MKKEIFIVFLCMMLFNRFYAQNINNVRYRVCQGCCTAYLCTDNGAISDYTYSDADNYIATEVASDFGPRVIGNYKWHGGVDLSHETGDADKGDLILPVETGQVTRIRGRFYKYMVISGANNIGYGHIFSSAEITTGHQRNGNVVLKKRQDDTDEYAILFLSLNQQNQVQVRAIGLGGTVEWDGQTYTVDNLINNIDEAIAPVGDSYGISGPADDLDAHLHLYNFGNDIDTGDEFTKNPLQFLTYPEPSFAPETDIQLGYDLAPSKVKIRLRMADQNGAGDYSVVQNANVVGVRLKQQGQSAYPELLRGKDYWGYISLGGSTVGAPESIYYPDYVNNDGNGNKGSWLKTGIDPFAYRLEPHDDYYFTDFYTRIHQNHSVGASLLLANIPKFAQYPDNRYTLHPYLIDANGGYRTFNDANSIENIDIDNFWPYVEGVNVYYNGSEVYKADYYSQGCQPNISSCDKLRFTDGTYPCTLLTTSGDPFFAQMKMRVLASEALLGTINGQLWDPAGTAYTINQIQSLDGGKGLFWEVVYENVRYDPENFPPNGEYKFEFYGEDKAGNDMLDFDTWDGTENIETVPHRTSATGWTPSNPASHDGKSRIYKFKLSNSCPIHLTDDSPSSSFSALNTDCDCEPVAAFTFTPRSDGLTFDFDASTSTGTEPLTYKWDFGDGTLCNGVPCTGIMPTHIFSEEGQYLVTLTVTDDCDNTATAEQAVTVSDGSSLHAEIVGPGQSLPNQEVSFNAIVTGGVPPYKYCWSAINGDPNPMPGPFCNCDLHEDEQIIRFEESTLIIPATVYVEITDATGQIDLVSHSIDIKPSALTLDFEHYPVNPTGLPGGDPIIPGQYLYWVANVDPLLETPYPADYTWNFGDGTPPITEPNGQTEHTFALAGTYTVTLEMCDLYGSCIPASKTYQVGGSNSGGDYVLLPEDTQPASWGNNQPEKMVTLTKTGGPMCGGYFKWDLFWRDCNYQPLDDAQSSSAVITVNDHSFIDASDPHSLYPWGCLYAYGRDHETDDDYCGGASENCAIFMKPSNLSLSNLQAQALPNCVYQLNVTVSGGGWKFDNPTADPNTPKKYKEYQWKAYDIEDPSQEIDILSNADSKNPTINTQHAYFDKFTNGRFPQFVVKLRVTDFANQIAETGDVISFNPFRLIVKNDYKRCPETWSYFESKPLATGGTGNYQFTWTTTSGSLDFESNDPHDPNPYFRTPASGSKQYTLVVEMLNATGGVECQLSEQINVTAAPLVLNLSDIPWPICGMSGREIGVFDLSNLGGSGRYGFEWTNDPNNYLSDVFSPHPFVSGIPPGQSITFTLTVGDLTSQCSVSDNLTITSIDNNYTASFSSSEISICYGEDAILIPQVSPIENSPPWGNVFNQFLWSTNNPHHELPEVGPALELPIDEIVSSHPSPTTPPTPFVYSLRYKNFVTGCYADASVNVIIREPWKHNGYNPAIKSVIQTTSVPLSSVPLWDLAAENLITSGIANMTNSGIEVTWWPSEPSSKTFNSGTVLPKNGMFTPTTAVPYLVMTVKDRATGCSKSYKTIRYIISEAVPKLWASASNTFTCIGGEVCFDIVFDAQLANYNTSLLPSSIVVGGNIHSPNISQQPSIKDFDVNLELVNSSGLYKGIFCESAFFQHETPGPKYGVFIHGGSIIPNIWSGVENIYLEVAIDQPSTSLGNVVDCIPPYSENGVERALSFKYGLDCDNNGITVHNKKSFSMAKDFIEIYPDYEIELIPSISLGAGARLGINPCIDQQLTEDEPDESQAAPIMANRAGEIELTPISPEVTLEVFPNPFTGEVNIQYTLPPDCKEEAFINLLDITGKHLRTIEKRKSTSGGQFEIIFDGKYLPPDVYFYELAAGNCRKIKKAIKIGF